VSYFCLLILTTTHCGSASTVLCLSASRRQRLDFSRLFARTQQKRQVPVQIVYNKVLCLLFLLKRVYIIFTSKPAFSTDKMSSDNISPPPTGAPEAPSTVATVSEGLSFTNSILMVLIAYLLWKMFGKSLRKRNDTEEEERLVIPDPLPKHDMTLDELRKYDGKGDDKRVCIAILGRVYDCTKSYHFYGPEGTYRNFAGHDATRALAKFDVMAVKEEWDDVSDLSQSEMSSVQEWKEQFEERYDYVGRLVKSLDDVVDTVDDDTEDVSTSSERPTSQVPKAKSHPSESSSSNESDLEVINPDQTEFVEQK